MLRVASYMFLFLLAASTSFAEEGHRSTVLDMTYRFINFAILFSVLYYFLAKPLKEFLASRSDAIKKALDEATFRRRGLAVTTILLALFGVALALKVRRMTRERVDKSRRVE